MSKQNTFVLKSEYSPAGDQPKAISVLVDGIKSGARHQTLLGVTGSGKTFAVANVIAQIGKPTLVIAHNKTLAAQLAQEYREFFPDAAVHYFVSYYDYYQPEAYVPTSDTYIEKEAQINEEIDRLRHASTQALLTRKDVIVVASVSCIYGLGSPKEYEEVHIKFVKGGGSPRAKIIRDLVRIYFERTNTDITPGTFRAVGNSIEIMPVNEKTVYRLDLGGDAITTITKLDPVSHTILDTPDSFFLFPAKHFVSSKEQIERAIGTITIELGERLKELEAEGKPLEVERLKRRTQYDMALIREVGYVSGIENYSRHFDGRAQGEPPYTLLDYFPKKKDGTPDFLTVIDESHVTVPQIGGMYAGDQSRKKTLIEYGFRLPSAADNRPLDFDEFSERVGQVVYTSATPKEYELEKSCPKTPNTSGRSGDDCKAVVEMIIRPTGLVDPLVQVRPIVAQARTGADKTQNDAEYGGQVVDFINEAEKTIKGGGRVLATTLTKRMAEDLTDYLKEKGIQATYIHSDIKTIERIDIITAFRKGESDILVGVNLLREGLDMPEVELIGILDADKEGFLRSDTSLIQTMGRAARNVKGRVILYADRITGSMERAIGETNRRREIQLAYNKEHGITPKSIQKKISDITDQMQRVHHEVAANALAFELGENPTKIKIQKLIKQKERSMNAAVKILDFESAAILRDEIVSLEEIIDAKEK